MADKFLVDSNMKAEDGEQLTAWLLWFSKIHIQPRSRNHMNTSKQGWKNGWKPSKAQDLIGAQGVGLDECAAVVLL